MTYRDKVHDAMFELQVLDAEESAGAAEASFVLGRMNAVLDYLNALDLAAYVEQFTIYTGSAIAPHTIGPSTATFTVAVRPDEILAANLRGSTSTLSTRTKLTIRDEAWWNKNLTPGTYGTPTDLYYRPSWPNGELNFYPLPSGAFYPELLTRQTFASGTLDTEFTLPPGFDSLVTKRLAMEIAPAFLPEGQPISPLTVEGARMALNALLSKHGRKPQRMTADVGHPGGYWDFRTSTFR